MNKEKINKTICKFKEPVERLKPIKFIKTIETKYRQIPIKDPIKQPAETRIKSSNAKCLKMASVRHPTAFIIPMSRVRSEVAADIRK
jgi:hypothetical protein